MIGFIVAFLFVLLVGLATNVQVAVVTLVVVALWGLSLLVYPQRVCRSCHGAGHRPLLGSAVTRTCGPCGGTGRLRRWGAPHE
jgi:hypothetical protein